jgi:SAM-dependent methyltransferase
MVADLYISGEYLQKNPTWHADEAPWKARQILRMLERHHLVPHTICEVGCGTGEILRLLQQALPGDSTLWGYEISPQAFELCQSRANEHLHFTLADIQQETGVHFDLILIMDVLEHLEDYFSLLRDLQPKSQYKLIQLPLDISVRSVLRGEIIRYRETYGHLHYFTKELALQMLKDTGYHVLDYSYSGQSTDSVPLPWSELTTHPRKVVRKVLGRAKRKLIDMPIRLAAMANEDFTVRFLGTSRLLILAE